MFRVQKLQLAGTLLFFLSASQTAYSSKGAWSSGPSFPGINRAHYIQWVLNSKAYFGTGSYVVGANLTFTKDVWEFDPATNTWTQKADFGGNIRTGTLNFTVGANGFAGCGADQFAVYNDFWKFDPVANTWTQIAYFPGPPRVYGQGFGMDTVGFAGMGRTFTAAGSTITYNDIYQYYPDSNQWSVKNNFPGITRSFASNFRIGNYNYLLAGQSGNPTNQLWQYDAALDQWTQKNAFPAGGRIGMTAIVVQDTAYAGLGRSQDPLSGITTYYKDLWLYDATLDQWNSCTDLPSDARFRAFGFGLDTIGYIGCGESASLTFNDGWWFNPRLETTGVGIQENDASLLSFNYNTQNAIVNVNGFTPNKAWNITLFTASGQQVFSEKAANSSEFQLSVSNYQQGVYILNASDGISNKAFRFVR